MADFPCQSEEVTHEATKLTNVLRSAEDDLADCSPTFPAVVPVRLHTAVGLMDLDLSKECFGTPFGI